MARTPQDDLARELARVLPNGWRHRTGPDWAIESVCFSRPAPAGLELGVEIYEEDEGVLGGEFVVRHPAAQAWLDAAGRPALVAVELELADAAGRPEPFAADDADWARCAPEVARLTTAAATVWEVRAASIDAFVAELREVPQRGPQMDDILLGLAAHDTPPPVPGGGTSGEAAAELLLESPLMVRLRAERPKVSARDLVRSAAGLVRALRGDGELSAGLPPAGAGPWLEVALEPDGEALVAAAFAASRHQYLTIASVAAELRFGAEQPELLLYGRIVGRLAAGVAPDRSGTAEVPMQIGRLGPERYMAQVQLPR